MLFKFKICLDSSITMRARKPIMFGDCTRLILLMLEEILKSDSFDNTNHYKHSVTKHRALELY